MRVLSNSTRPTHDLGLHAAHKSRVVRRNVCSSSDSIWNSGQGRTACTSPMRATLYAAMITSTIQIAFRSQLYMSSDSICNSRKDAPHVLRPTRAPLFRSRLDMSSPGSILSSNKFGTTRTARNPSKSRQRPYRHREPGKRQIPPNKTPPDQLIVKLRTKT